jgi:hypothetical protein
LFTKKTETCSDLFLGCLYGHTGISSADVFRPGGCVITSRVLRVTSHAGLVTAANLAPPMEAQPGIFPKMMTNKINLQIPSLLPFLIKHKDGIFLRPKLYIKLLVLISSIKR